MAQPERPAIKFGRRINSIPFISFKIDRNKNKQIHSEQQFILIAFYYYYFYYYYYFLKNSISDIEVDLCVAEILRSRYLSKETIRGIICKTRNAIRMKTKFRSKIWYNYLIAQLLPNNNLKVNYAYVSSS